MAKITSRTKQAKISDVFENKQNPRQITGENLEKLKDSIASFKEMLSIRPIVCNNKGMILGGNMRYQACKLLGMKTIPVCFVSGLTKQQEQEFIIKDNVDAGLWDFEELKLNWDTDLLSDWGLSLPDWRPEDGKTETEKKEKYLLTVTCKNKEHQEDVYAELISAGYDCKMQGAK